MKNDTPLLEHLTRLKAFNKLVERRRRAEAKETETLMREHFCAADNELKEAIKKAA